MVEGHRLRRGLVNGAGDGIRAAERKLLQHVIFKRSGWHGDRGDDRKRDAHPFGIEEEEQLVVADGAAEAASEMVDGRAGLVIAGGGIGEVIGGVEQGAVPEFVEISVKFDSSPIS